METVDATETVDGLGTERSGNNSRWGGWLDKREADSGSVSVTSNGGG
jgi:hypothetical protein